MRPFLAATILLLVLSMLPWGAYAGAHGALWQRLGSAAGSNLQTDGNPGVDRAEAMPAASDRAGPVLRQAERPCRTATVPASSCGLHPWLAAEAATGADRAARDAPLRPEPGRFLAGRTLTIPPGPPRQA